MIPKCLPGALPSYGFKFQKHRICQFRTISPMNLRVLKKRTLVHISPISTHLSIPPDYLSRFDYCLNVHPSDLPEWRGAAPLTASILSQNPTTRVSLQTLSVGTNIQKKNFGLFFSNIKYQKFLFG
jgi:hypothetical protein